MARYIAIQYVSCRDLIMSNGRYGAIAITLNAHEQALRKLAANADAIKKFPVIRSYTNHQHSFISIWLFLLPLTITIQAG